jgi:preprotein translocase SecE subunit
MDNRKIIIAFHLASSAVLWFLSRAFVEWLFLKFYQLRRLPGAVGIREGVPVVLALVLLVVLYQHRRVNEVLDEVVSELRKVTWPALTDVQKSTLVVILCILLASGILAGFDFVWGKVIGFLLQS